MMDILKGFCFSCTLVWVMAAVQAQKNATIEIVPLEPPTKCLGDVRLFDPLIHKPEYTVGVEGIRGLAAALQEFNLTFGAYLTETAGRRFDPPINFTMAPQTMKSLFTAMDQGILDFHMTNPGSYSCIGVEFGAQPLATLVARTEVRGITYETDVFGGVIFTRADNDEINEIKDLKDKVIGAGGITLTMAAQIQFHEMLKAGVNYVTDPKQVIFTYNLKEIVDGVFNKTFDVGFVRTGQIERTNYDMDEFKVLNPKVHILEDGSLFPFFHSTNVYGEFVLAADPSVSVDVAGEVQRALLALREHADVGKQLINGGAYEPRRCDTTEGIARLAWEASFAGKHAGFHTPESYFPYRSLHEELGLIKQDERGDWKCVRADNLYESISCPAGHFKLDEKGYNETCPTAGLSCRAGWDCFCKPCIKAHDVDIFECQNDGAFFQTDREVGCDKMSVCATTTQTQEIQFCLGDNLGRADARVEVIMHMGGVSERIPVTYLNQTQLNWTSNYRGYKFNWTSKTMGMSVMEIEINGEQISQSPVLVEVAARDCESVYGPNLQAGPNGECICANNTVNIGGSCVSTTVIAVVISMVLLLVAFVAGIVIIRHQNFKNDQAWMVAVEELHFDDPVEVIGQGAFGVVLKAEYRGTKVAIKKAMKYKGNHGASVNRTASSKKNSPRVGQIVSRQSMEASKGPQGSLDDIKSSNMLLMDSDSKDEGTDPELGATSNSVVKSISGSMSFLNGFHDHHRRSWNSLCFWKKREHYHTNFKDSALGQSQSVSRKSIGAIICPWFNEQARQEAAFMSEMRVLSSLRHPCITTVMGAVVSRHYEPMLVMEFLEYGSLHDILLNGTMHLAGEIILQMCRDVASGLRYLHSSKPPVMHGDMKARNILIDSRFRAKLCDFGLSNKTTSLVTGTPFWMAPEYLTGRTVYTCSCDIYSFGIILWEVYARKSPYEGEHFRDVLRKVCDRRVNKRPVLDDTFPPKMVDLMKKCWSADAASRPLANNLDMTLNEMAAYDAEPVQVVKEEVFRGERVFDELFPKHIAEALKAGQKVEPEEHDMVTVVFTEIVDFADLTKSLDPMKITRLLGRLFHAFDQLAKAHGVFKVETVGHNWLGVSNLEKDQHNSHVKRVAELAIAMVNEANKMPLDEEAPDMGGISVKAGFHSGSIVTNVIGSLNPRYGLFGDTVNTASRMQSNSKRNRILCSEYSHSFLHEQAPDLPTRKRGKIPVKGKGVMTVYWVGDGLLSTPKESVLESQCTVTGKKVEFVGAGEDSTSPGDIREDAGMGGCPVFTNTTSHGSHESEA